jgi:hypothetical protein
MEDATPEQSLGQIIKVESFLDRLQPLLFPEVMPSAKLSINYQIGL